MGGPDQLVFSEDSWISHHEELHPHEYLPSRSITHFSMPIDLDRQGARCAPTPLPTYGAIRPCGRSGVDQMDSETASLQPR